MTVAGRAVIVAGQADPVADRAVNSCCQNCDNSWQSYYRTGRDITLAGKIVTIGCRIGRVAGGFNYSGIEE